MGCDGPELPDNNPQEITAPPRHDLDDVDLEDSDDERVHFGYELLPQDSDALRYDNDPDSEDERIFQRIYTADLQAGWWDALRTPHRDPPTEPINNILPEASSASHTQHSEQVFTPAGFDVPPIEPMASVLMREVWNAPRPQDSIEMTADRAEQIRSAMASFTLPFQAEPIWGPNVSNQMLEQWIRNRLDRSTNKNN